MGGSRSIRLRWRRQKFEILGGAGFLGYSAGSRQHMFSASLHPFEVATRIAASASGIGLVSISVGLMLIGASRPLAVASGVSVVVGLWLIGGVVTFTRSLRTTEPMPPPRPNPGAAGVREPRRPPPNPGTLSVERILPVD